MHFLSHSYDTLFLNLWPLIAGVLLSWHHGLVNAWDGPDSCYFIFFFSICRILIIPPSSFFTLCCLFLELGRV